MLDTQLLLAHGATYKRIPKGGFVFQEGAVCTHYYQLAEGRVKWVNASDGRDVIQSMIEPGQSFGEFPLFDDQPYAAGAQADTDSLVLKLPKPVFLQLMNERPELLFHYCRKFVSLLRFKFMIQKEMACYDPEHQVMTLLEYFRSIDCGNKDQANEYRVNLTRQQIADMTGLRVETVIRVIKKLEHSGRLSIDKGKVFLQPA